MSAAQLSELKARIDLVDLVSDRVELRRRGREWWGRCPFHEDGTPSFKVDPERQGYHCFGCSAHGDALDFVMAMDRIDMKAAIERLEQLAGKAPDRHRRQQAPRARPAGDNSPLAQEIWQQSERIHDRLALDYLVCRRGIPAWDDDRLRWHPECPWGAERVGCIVCPVTSHETRRVVAIWRIKPALDGKVERRGLGPAKHNLAPIWWPEADEIGITEGVEDALAVRHLTGLPAWAALSAGNMAELRGVPTWIRHVTIFADLDDVGRRSAHALADRLRAEGREARVVRAIDAKDPNDALLARAA